MKIPPLSHGRRAVAGIVAGVILFVMLFSVGTGFFIYQAGLTHRYDVVNGGGCLGAGQCYPGAQQQILQKMSEALTLITSLSGSNKSMISVTATNTGGVGVVIIGAFVENETRNDLVCMSPKPPSGTPLAPSCGILPSVIPAGIPLDLGVQESLIVNPHRSVTCTNSTLSCTVGLITQRGNVFTQAYPMPQAQNSLINALTAGAIGDLYLTFGSYTYYTVSNSGCSTGAGLSGLCLHSPSPGFSITAPSGQVFIAFSVAVTDLNPAQKSVTLDQFTALFMVLVHASSGTASIPWSIVSVSGTQLNIMTQYTPVTLTYNSPAQTLYFAAATCASQTAPTGMNPYGNLGSPCPAITSTTQIQSISSTGSIKISAGYDATVFIMAHGWEYFPMPPLASLSYTGTNPTNYAQNLPYVTTVFVQPGS